MIGEGIPVELEIRIQRDLVRSRRLTFVTWGLALASIVAGLVSLRQAALLVSVDRHLVGTEDVRAIGAAFDVVRAFVAVLVAVGLLLAVRFVRGLLPVFEELRARGVVDGPLAGPGLAKLAILWRPAGVPADQVGWADVRAGPGRRGAVVSAVVTIVAAVVGLAAAVALAAATDAEASRWWRLVIGVDGALWLAAWVLIGVTIDAIRWREAAAARALGVFVPLGDAPGHSVVRLVPPLLLFGAGVLAVSGRPDSWFVPCPPGSLACDGMLVPVDHDGGSSGTIWIVFAMHHAVGVPKGTLAIAVGGPGGSGLDESLLRLEDLDPDLVSGYDILFWDQRGIGASDGKDCPAAGYAYATTKQTEASTKAFVDACLREAGVAPGDVTRYSTHQAAEDLESIRDHLGLARFALYGESYGTELAQLYAASHPDRLSALVLDGAVDLTLSANEFWAAAAKGFDRTLQDTFTACLSDGDCRTDMNDPGAAFERALQVLATPQKVSYADSDGTVRDHAVDAVAVESAFSQLLYEPAGRAVILRSVAAAAHGDDVPLARLIQVLGSGEGPGVSEFAYHAITCADYRVSPTADPHDFAAVEAYAQATGVDDLRTARVYSSQLPCLWWPYQPASGQRPAPISSTPYPVFVLGATDDPVTPVEQARAIAGRLSDGYLITTSGGPHVTFGRGDRCVDEPVVSFLLDGRRPPQRTIDCAGDVVQRYVALTPGHVTGYADALSAMEATRSELFADPEVLFWNGKEALRVGCRDGGFFSLTFATAQDDIQFSKCEFADGLPLTGAGTLEVSSGALHWNVTFPDGDLTFDSTGDDAHVSGHWRGQAVDQSS